MSKYQAFNIVKVHRSRLVEAPYNPRFMDRHARRRLREGIKKVGLVEPIVWNVRTGHIVGGHQRVAALDALEKSQDYELEVAQIDVTEEREKEINILLNNPSAQGLTDFGALAELLGSSNLDPKAMGFDAMEVSMLLADVSKGMAEEQDKAVTDVAALKARKKEQHRQAEEWEDREFFVVVVFPSRKEVDAFLTQMNLPLDLRYVDGMALCQDLGIDVATSAGSAES